MKKTHFENIRSHITNEIRQVNDSIKLMLAWFTDQELSSELDKLSQEISIQIILSNSEWNLLNKKHLVKLMKRSNTEIKTYGSNSPLNGEFMHRKICIIDNNVVINGSYNWTKNASKNNEDISISYDEKDANDCINEFTRLWNQSETIDFQKIESHLPFNLEDLKSKEDEGLTPEQFHLIDPSKIEQPKNINEESKAIIVPEKSYTDQLLTRINNVDDFPKEPFELNESLPIWGVEKYHTRLDNYLRLKFNLNDQIINVQVKVDDFKEVLKINKLLFNLYNKNKYRFPLLLFNDDSESKVRLKAPIKLKSIRYQSHLHKCHFELITETNGIVTQKIELTARYDVEYNQIYYRNELHSMGYF